MAATSISQRRESKQRRSGSEFKVSFMSSDKLRASFVFFFVAHEILIFFPLLISSQRPGEWSASRVVRKLNARGIDGASSARCMICTLMGYNRTAESRRRKVEFTVFTYRTSTNARRFSCSYAPSDVPTRIPSERSTCVLSVSPERCALNKVEERYFGVVFVRLLS